MGEVLSQDEGLVQSLKLFFDQFDQSFCIREVFEDLSDLTQVRRKAEFVSDEFRKHLNSETALIQAVLKHAPPNSSSRQKVSLHTQGWVLEMLIYFTNLSVSEDISTRFKGLFEQSKHNIKAHAPYGDSGMSVAYLIRGLNLSSQWNDNPKKRTLSSEEFHYLSYETFARCVAQAYSDRGHPPVSIENMINRYRQVKSLRILASDLNAFHIMADARLGDLFHFKFNVKDDDEQILSADEWQTVRRSFFTDIMNELYGARPLETWFQGQSKDGKWLLKIQSAPSNPGDKCKEIAGRCRASKLAWEHGKDPKDRSQWRIVRRETPQFALLLDGEWAAWRKRWLYEAGWDWVGDVSEIPELRKLMDQPN